MNNKPKNQGIVNNLDMIFDLIEHSIRSSIGVIQKVKKLDRLSKALSDDKNKSIIIPSFGAVDIIRKASKDYRKEKTTFFDLLHRRFEDINRYDPELGRLINSVFIKQRLSPLIMRIRIIFLQYEKEKVFEYFKQHYSDYSTKLSQLGNKELANNVISIIWKFLMSYGRRKTQINSIQNFANNVKSWSSVNGNVGVYVEEARGYISELRKINDKEINSFLNLDEIKRISTYQRELILLNDILRRVSLGEKEETWKDFINVYKNMKHIIRAIEERYFDKRTADELRLCLKDNFRYGEHPGPWITKIDEIRNRLKNEKDIIREFQSSLLELFSKSINRSKEVSENEFMDSKRSIVNVIGKIKDIPNRYKGLLLRVVKKKEKVSNERLVGIREKYNADEASLRSIAERFSYLLKTLKSIKLDSVVENVRNIENTKIELCKRGIAVMGLIRGDGPRYFKILSDNMFKIWPYENKLKSKWDNLEKEGQRIFYLQLPKLIDEFERIIIPNFENELDRLINILETMGLKDKIKRMAA
jgi:hypothetical protein